MRSRRSRTSFDAMQEELVTEEEMAMHNTGEANPRPLWTTARGTIERSGQWTGTITNRMDNMFMLPSQRMDSIEARLGPDSVQRAGGPPLVPSCHRVFPCGG